MELIPSEFVLPSRFNSYGCMELYRYWLLIVLNITRYGYIMAILFIFNVVADPCFQRGLIVDVNLTSVFFVDLLPPPTIETTPTLPITC